MSRIEAKHPWGRGSAVTIITISLTLAACGGPQTDDPGAVSTSVTDTTALVEPGPGDTTAGRIDEPTVEVDTCGLLSEEEIADALGSPGEADPWDSPPSFNACTWTAPDGAAVFASVTVHSDQQAAETIFVNWMTSNGFTEVSGIGDVAYTGSEITLNVLSGVYEVEVDVDDDDVERSKQLIGIILERLP
jgi:hypothetical protein